MKMLQAIPFTQFHDRIRLVDQYQPDSVTISLEQINPVGCQPLRKIINPQRLVISSCILQTFVESAILPYLPVQFLAEIDLKVLRGLNGHTHSANPHHKTPFYILPPIIEQHANSYFIIDGLHRIYLAKTLNYEKIHVLLLKGVNEPLPADAISWSDLVYTRRVLSREEKFSNLNEKYWRNLIQIYQTNS